MNGDLDAAFGCFYGVAMGLAVFIIVLVLVL